jgi:hypothetical protein
MPLKVHSDVYLQGNFTILKHGSIVYFRRLVVVPGCEFRVKGWMKGLGFKVQGSGFRVRGSGFRVQGSGCRVQGSGFRVQGSGCRVQDLGFRVEVWASGFRVDEITAAAMPAIIPT